MASSNSQKLDWRNSIVALMERVGIDSGLAARKSLAQELGYTGSTDDSATMKYLAAQGSHAAARRERRQGASEPARLVAILSPCLRSVRHSRARGNPCAQGPNGFSLSRG
jgi:hypothetical protein